MQEELYPIKGFEGRYSITKSGKVYSHLRKKGFLNLSTSGKKDWYLMVQMNDRTYSVHRLVLSTFKEIPFDGAQANHINGDKRDNRLENLEWCTAKENTHHAIHSLNRPKPFYTSFTEEQATKIKERLANGERQMNLAKEFSVSKWVMNKLAKGRTFANA